MEPTASNTDGYVSGAENTISSPEARRATLRLVVPARDEDDRPTDIGDRPPKTPRTFHRNFHTRLTAGVAPAGDPDRWQDRRRRPLTMGQYHAIRRRLSLGESPRRISNALGVRIAMVRWLAQGVRPVEVRDA